MQPKNCEYGCPHQVRRQCFTARAHHIDAQQGNNHEKLEPPVMRETKYGLTFAPMPQIPGQVNSGVRIECKRAWMNDGVEEKMRKDREPNGHPDIFTRTNKTQREQACLQRDRQQ